MPPNRRFFRRLLLTSTVTADRTGAVGPERGIADTQTRRDQALAIHRQAPQSQSEVGSLPHLRNGDEDAHLNRIASYSKGLPYNQLGEVEASAYDSLLRALLSGKPADFEQIARGSGRPPVNSQAGFAFSLDGVDAQRLTAAPLPGSAVRKPPPR